MPDRSLWDVFRALPQAANASTTEGEYLAARVEVFEGLHIGKDANHRPVLFIEVRDAGRTRTLQLANVWITHSVCVTVQSPTGGRHRITASLLGCTADDASLHRLFLDCLATVIPPKLDDRSGPGLNALVDQLVEIFACVNASNANSAAGLWGELLTIAVSRNPVRMVEAWHEHLDDRFDFSSGCSRMEVKTTTSRERKHTFSFSQANPGPGVEATVVSITTEPAHGMTLGTLRRHCIDLMQNRHELRAKIDRSCADYLGRRWAAEMETSYDLEVALSTIAVFDVDDIPRLAAPLPCGVVDAHFTAVLSFTVPLPWGAKPEAALAASLLPCDAQAVALLRERCRAESRSLLGM